MKNPLLKLAFITLGILLLLSSAHSVSAQESYPYGESISSFTSDLTVKPDGNLRVVETVKYDFGQYEKHGFFRVIPLGFKAKGQIDHTRITVESVTDERGNSYPYQVTSKDPLIVRMGSEDTFVNGKHTYVLTYLVRSSIGFFDSYDELYWNLTGKRWQVPMGSVSASIHLPAHVPRNSLQISQYCGLEGEKEQCGAMQIKDDGTVEFETLPGYTLLPEHQITIAVGFPKGVLQPPGLTAKIAFFLKTYWFIPIPFLLTALWFQKRIRYWVKRRSFYKTHPIIAEYDPRSYTPLEAAFLVNGTAGLNDVTATIISLAVRGCLKITDDDDEFSFTKIQPSRSKNAIYENNLLDELHEKHSSDLGFEFINRAFGAISITLDSLVARQYALSSQQKDSIFAVFDTIPIREVSGKKSRLVLPIFLAFNPGMFIWGFLGIGPGIAFSGTCLLIAIVYLFVDSGQLVLLEKGLQAQHTLLGLKRYIEVAEKDRIQFANAPAKTPELFEKLLPYAMVFGLEEKWAGEFEEIYAKAPSWYAMGSGQFSTIALLAGLHAIESTSSQFSTFSLGSSLSSSRSSWGGSSGSSGGGSSGGGGGGGGGGSW